MACRNEGDTMGGSEWAKTALSYSQLQRPFQENTRSIFFYVLFLDEVRRDHVPTGCGQWKLYFYLCRA
jgi:hypothetical protein